MKTTEKISMAAKLVVLPAMLMAALASCTSEDKDAQIRQLQADKEKAQTELSDGYGTINEMMATLNEVEENLQTIKEKEKIITMNSEEGSPNDRQRRRIIRDVNLINSLLKKSQDQIASLNEKMERSQIGMEEFKRKIADLDKIMKERETDIATLKKGLEQKDFQISVLNETVNELVDENMGQQAKIVKQDNDLNKVYYAYGTFSDLKDMGVLTKEGGFLGMGKDKVLKEGFNQDYFMEVDKRDLRILPIYSKKAKLITEHPETSYAMVKGQDDYTYLEIKDPTEFWKVSNYLVMELK